MIYEWHSIFTPGVEGVGWREGGGGAGRGAGAVTVRSEQLKESGDDGMRGEAGAMTREQKDWEKTEGERGEREEGFLTERKSKTS